ncbi:hypothetical protein BKA70DRAFT_1282619 [Coprinopsis sp. MPI-PUGE-AT-0042]|nr:hypothetical protein BKA70DRAFT_1282619 [Coprinopsis sp. MPI-PUGE-AT-0042]
MPRRSRKAVGTTPDHPDHPNKAEHVKALAAAVEVAPWGGWQKVDILSYYIVAARGILFLVHLFLNVEVVLRAKLAPWIKESTTQEKADFEAITAIMPGEFKKVLRMLYDLKPAVCERFIDKLAKTAYDQRSHDFSKFKKVFTTYLDKLTGTYEPLTAHSDYALRGFKSRQCTIALAPIEDQKKFRKKPDDYMQDIDNGDIEITHESFPSFLWHYQKKDLDYQNLDLTMFESPLLAKVARWHITGPSTANGGARESKRPSRAQLSGVTAPTIPLIGYWSIMLHYAANPMKEWAVEWGDIDYEGLYENIVSMLRRDGDMWKRVAAWFLKEVPGLQDSRTRKRNAKKVKRYDGPQRDPVSEILKQKERRLLKEQGASKATGERSTGSKPTPGSKPVQKLPAKQAATKTSSSGKASSSKDIAQMTRDQKPATADFMADEVSDSEDEHDLGAAFHMRSYNSGDDEDEDEAEEGDTGTQHLVVYSGDNGESDTEELRGNDRPKKTNKRSSDGSGEDAERSPKRAKKGRDENQASPGAGSPQHTPKKKRKDSALQQISNRSPPTPEATQKPAKRRKKKTPPPPSSRQTRSQSVLSYA